MFLVWFFYCLIRMLERVKRIGRGGVLETNYWVTRGINEILVFILEIKFAFDRF